MSLTATPFKAVAFELLMVKVSVVVPLSGIFAAPNAFAMDGAFSTFRVAVLLTAPVPPSVEVTALVVLFLLPAVVPVTSAEKVHDDPAAGDAVRVPPERLMAPLPATAVIVPLPQEPVTLGVAATATPAGRVSVKAMPLRALAVLGLVMVKLSVLLAFSAMLVGLKALLMVGGATTVKLAVLLVAPAPDSVELIAPVVFDLVPAVVPVTFTLMEHEPLDASVPLDKLMVFEPAVSDTVPTHVVLAPVGLATTKPAGRVSEKATPVRANPEFGFAMLNVKLVVPLSGMLAAPNALLIVGGLATVSVAVLLAAPVPPLVELIVPVVLSLAPEVVPFTSTLIVHIPLAASVPLARLIELEPATAVTEPPHTPTTLGAAATCKPATSVSPKAMPFKVVPVFGLLMVNVMVDVPFTPIVVGENALLMVGAATTATLSLHELLASLLSAMLLLGSTEQVPPVGLA